VDKAQVLAAVNGVVIVVAYYVGKWSGGRSR
jgi:hypothetical protein